MVPQLSTAKSSQQMFGSVTKSYWAEPMEIAPDRSFNVSIIPCTVVWSMS